MIRNAVVRTQVATWQIRERAEHTLTHREEGVEGLEVAAFAGIIGAAVIVLAYAIRSKAAELWANIGG